MSILTVAATVVGQSHLARGAGCEDAFSIVKSEDGRWTSAVLCDGCGSSKHAAEGARVTAHFLCQELVKIGPRIDADGPGEWVVDKVVTGIASLREAMRGAYGSDLREYSATVVAALVSDRGGFMLHVGDGIVSAFSGTDDGQLKLSSQSNPKNGEYANETFYLTEPGWIRNVYITPIASNPAVVLLCTDGAQDVIYDGNSPVTQKATEFLNICLANPSEGPHILEKFLLSPIAARRNNDDKGCIIIYNTSILLKAASGELNITAADNIFEQKTQSFSDIHLIKSASSAFNAVEAARFHSIVGGRVGVGGASLIRSYVRKNAHDIRLFIILLTCFTVFIFSVYFIIEYFQLSSLLSLYFKGSQLTEGIPAESIANNRAAR